MTLRYVATIRVKDGVMVLQETARLLGGAFLAAFGLGPKSGSSTARSYVPEIAFKRIPWSDLLEPISGLLGFVLRPGEFATVEHIGALLGGSSRGLSTEITDYWIKAVRDWVAEGRVQATQFDGDWYIAKSELERILSSAEIVESKLSSSEAVERILSSEIPSHLLTTRQAAEVLCTSAEIVRKWVADGTLPATKVSRRWRIHKSEVEKLRGPVLAEQIKSKLASLRGFIGLWENLSTARFPLAECDLRHFTQKQEETALSLGSADDKQYWLHKGEIYWANQMYTTDEVKLLIWEKKERERRKFERLRKQMEAAGHIDEARRERIPEDVRTFVWRRDGGRCVRCGRTQNLEFDHIIPVSKGGSSSVNNVQLLCAECNRKKSDHI